jgi:hypothetical protein
MPNSQVPFIGDFVRIVCAISNKYFPPISSPDQTDRDKEMATKMLQQCEKSNDLKIAIEDMGLNRKVKVWKTVNECDISNFPRLSDEQLSNLTFGVYQLRMSSSYIQEHLEGNCDIHVHVDEPGLLSVKMQSRHISSKKYIMWIRFNDSAIDAWYCQCRAGARVVGMCSHIAAIVWFLSSARYQGKETYGVRDWSLHLSDAATFPVDDDSSSCENE